jgi:hypothetical protein
MIIDLGMLLKLMSRDVREALAENGLKVDWKVAAKAAGLEGLFVDQDSMPRTAAGVMAQRLAPIPLPASIMSPMSPMTLPQPPDLREYRTGLCSGMTICQSDTVSRHGSVSDPTGDDLPY